MKIYNFEQRSPEWSDMRKLKMTASHATAIGNSGKGLETYIYKLVAEYYSNAIPKNIDNEDTRRGNELEPQARSIYELETNNKVNEVGFIERDKYVGCSPDGLVGKDGGIEIKCPNDIVYFTTRLDNKIDTGYMWQIQMNLLITGRKWWDYVVYNPNFEKYMLIIRVKPNLEQFKKLEDGFKKGREMIEDLINKYKQNGKTKR